MSLLPATSHRDPTTPFWADRDQGTVGDVTTILAGTGISVANGTGPIATVTNTGVNTIVAGTGIGASGTTAVTLTNTGVTSIVAGSGISVSGGTGAVTITNTGSADIWALAPSTAGQSTTANVVASLGTQTLSKTYNYAEGYGFLTWNALVFGTAPTITVYLSSGSSPLALDTAKAIGYVLRPADASTTFTGQYIDLSTIKHYDPAGFTSVTLTFVATVNGVPLNNASYFPNISTSGFTNSTTTPVTVTRPAATPSNGAAGFKFFTIV